MNLENEIADALAKEIAAEIDFDVMSNLMTRRGWHKVKLGYFENNNQAVDIYDWVQDNAKGNFIRQGTIYVFEHEGDAVNFSLRWA